MRENVLQNQSLFRDDLKGPDDWRVYELVVRHFLACCSRDAKGQETKVKVGFISKSIQRSQPICL